MSVLSSFLVGSFSLGGGWGSWGEVSQSVIVNFPEILALSSFSFAHVFNKNSCIINTFTHTSPYSSKQIVVKVKKKLYMKRRQETGLVYLI